MSISDLIMVKLLPLPQYYHNFCPYSCGVIACTLPVFSTLPW